MKAHEIVVPDTLGDYNDTIAKGLAFTRYTREGFRYMAVAQGQTINQVMQCVDMFVTDSKFSYVTTIGIPRLINMFETNGRQKVTELILNRGYNRAVEFHYLGAAAPFVEVSALAAYNEPDFRGIDTSGPIYMAAKKFLIDESDYLQRPSHYFRINSIPEDALEYNLMTYLGWAKYDQLATLPARYDQNT